MSALTWTPVAKGFGGLNDGPAVSVDPGATGSVYALGDTVVGGDVQKSTDGGTTWKKVTFPPYCTPIGPTCPIALADKSPPVYMLAYVPPPAAVVSVYFAPFFTYNAYVPNSGSWFSDVPGWVSPNGHNLAELPLLHAAAWVKDYRFSCLQAVQNLGFISA